VRGGHAWAKFVFWVWRAKLEARRAERRGPKGRRARPEGPIAGVRFLGRGQRAPSPPARGSGGALLDVEDPIKRI